MNQKKSMKYQLYREQQLNCDQETAWKFFSSPNNLAKITPKDMGFTVLSNLDDQPIKVGMVIDYTVSPLFGIPLRWIISTVLPIFKRKGLINCGIIITNLFRMKREF